MREFEYCVSTEVCFGANTVDKVAELAKKHGATRVLIVTGGTAVRTGLLDRVSDMLHAAGIVTDSISGVQPNPRLSLAREGVKKALALGADLILAIGGGSVIDTAKAIAHGNANPDTDLWEFWKQRAPLTKSTPVGVILTIPAAGSETSNSAVITDWENHEKRGLNTPFNRPAFALLDPALATTLPKKQVACGVVDIMMHTLDRYFNAATDNETSDALAEALLRVVVRNGAKVYADPTDLHAMSEIVWCGSLSHNGLTGLGGVKDFAPHQLGHAIGEKFDAYHGETLSAVWSSFARYVCPNNPQRFADYARNVWGIDEADTEKAAQAGIAATEAYFRSLDMPVRISTLIGKQDEEGLQDLASRCSFGKTRVVGSFKKLAWADMLQIYRLANEEDAK